MNVQELEEAIDDTSYYNVSAKNPEYIVVVDDGETPKLLPIREIQWNDKDKQLVIRL